MNITELARQLRMHPEELKRTLPELGFDIGMRAIKVDDRTARKIVEQWPILKREIERKKKLAKDAKAAEEIKQVASAAAPIDIPGVITVRDFALRLGLPVSKVIGELMKNGILAALNERIDYDTASIVAEDMGFSVVREEGQSSQSSDQVIQSVDDKVKAILEAEEKGNLSARPPVVVVLGHVDHGKTKLLDAIRKTNVVEGEAGGITQHIGAYQVEVRPKDEPKSRAQRGVPSSEILRGAYPEAARRAQNDRTKKITFIDTPGHEAFTAMRSRGARVADIAVLVVAADDGVQPQTKEAIKIIQAAKLPFVVALNKIDKSDANADKVKRELSDAGVLPDDWGGTIRVVPLSAKTGQGVDQLLEVIVSVAEPEKDKIMANPNRRAVGTVIESHVDKNEGPLATVLVQTGTLRVGDDLAVGTTLYGRVKAMKDHLLKPVSSAPPSMPVRVLGFKVAPTIGDVVEVPKPGAELVKVRPAVVRSEKLATVERVAVTSEEEKPKIMLNLVVKADVLGSLEAIIVSLDKFKHPEVSPIVVGKGLGNVSADDLQRATSSKAAILGFHVQIPADVADLAREQGVTIKRFDIIYDLLDFVRDELERLLPPELMRTDVGKVRVLAIFRSDKHEHIAGGVVLDGRARAGIRVSIMRGGFEEGQGTLESVQVGKQTVAEAKGGSEFGMKLKSKTAPKVGDELILFTEEKKVRKL